MVVKDKETLRELVKDLQQAQLAANDAIDLEDEDLNGTYDIYSKLGNVIFDVEDLIENN